MVVALGQVKSHSPPVATHQLCQGDNGLELAPNHWKSKVELALVNHQPPQLWASLGNKEDQQDQPHALWSVAQPHEAHSTGCHQLHKLHAQPGQLFLGEGELLPILIQIPKQHQWQSPLDPTQYLVGHSLGGGPGLLPCPGLLVGATVGIMP